MCKRLLCTVSLVLLMSLILSGPASAELVGWWPMDDGTGTVALDATGNGNDGVFNGDPQWGVGQLGGALEFDGSGDWLDCGDGETLSFGGAVTIAAWFKVNALGLDHKIGGNQNNSNGGYKMSIYTNNKVEFEVRDASNAGTLNRDVAGGTVLEVDTWYHVFGIYSEQDGYIRTYINGVLDRELTTASVMGISPGPMRLGCEPFTTGSYHFNGVMDDVRVYNHAVTEAEMPLIMLGGRSEELASMPNPDDESVDVVRDVVLGWKAGSAAVTHDVYFGTSFEDVNAAERSNPMGVLVSQDQSDTRFDPEGLLEFGQTYYWRIDEVNGAPDYAIFKGDVWSFMSEPFAYAVENIVATTNTTSAEGQGPEKLVDGSGLNESDQHSTSTADMWSGSPNPDEPSYVQFDFDRVYKLYEMLVWNYNMEFEMWLGVGLKDITVEYSPDGTEWMVLGDYQLAQAPGRATYIYGEPIAFDGVGAKAVRLVINGGWGMAANLYGLSEVRFMYIPAHATKPQPADGATDVALDTELSWRSGREAASHEIYLSVDPNALTLAGTTVESSYTPANLDLNTMYYWQIVEVNDAEAISAWDGDVWSFTTQEYIEIDGFETYNDDIDAGTTIWQTWIDGIDDSTNGGGVVGNPSSPFAEQTIVRTGDQSMNFFFTNDSTSAISEADRTFSPAQNWASHGVKSLTLWFYGAESNSGQLYVKINNNKVLYDGPAVNIARPAWQMWSIDLSTVGNVSNVTTLTIGVQGLGSGVVYVDDVRLYPEVLDYSNPDISGAGDTVVGVPNDGDWPDAETPSMAIDDNVNTKYLHRKGGSETTGFQIAPLAGPTIVTGLTFTTANDTPTRDPIVFELSGSNAGIDGPYTLIASGDIVDFAGVTEWPRLTKTETPIEFNNSTAYSYYQIVFPTLRGSSETLMQIAEVEFIGTIQ